MRSAKTSAYELVIPNDGDSDPDSATIKARTHGAVPARADDEGREPTAVIESSILAEASISFMPATERQQREELRANVTALRSPEGNDDAKVVDFIRRCNEAMTTEHQDLFVRTHNYGCEYCGYWHPQSPFPFPNCNFCEVPRNSGRS